MKKLLPRRPLFPALLPSLLLWLVLTGSATGSDQCVYRFDVWNPGEDVLRRMNSLELQCSNNNAAWRGDLAKLQAKIDAQLLSAVNSSQQLQLALMAQNITALELSKQLLQLSHKLAQLEERRDVGGPEPETAGQSGKSMLPSESVGTAAAGRSRQQLALLMRLKNGVGDLKAEWMLMRRELTEVAAGREQAAAEVDVLRKSGERRQRLIDKLAGAQKSIWESIGKMRTSFQADQDLGRMDMHETTDMLKGRVSQVEESLKLTASLSRESLFKGLTNQSLVKLQRWLLDRASPKATDTLYHSPPKDCQEVLDRGLTGSGVYQILPRGASQAEKVYCEIINGSAWTVIQRRQDDSVRFSRPWLQYKIGFGNLYGEFWLGNDKISLLTRQGRYQLRVDMWDWSGKQYTARYGIFRVQPEAENYKLKIQNFLGGKDAKPGNSLGTHDGMSFSTEDRDNDLSARNCAADLKSGWWFNSCFVSNLNGVYKSGWYQNKNSVFPDGIVWFGLRESEFYSLNRVEMKIKRAD